MSAPSTPEPLPPRALLSQSHPTIRRVHTLPPSLVDQATSPSQGNHAADTIESLFTIHFAKVVAFEVAASRSRPGSSSGLRGADTDGSDGTLPWASPTERTLAAGPLRIYRVRNTGIAFLNSGSFLKPVLQKSQCWCVDNEAKFVLRVREDSYYRIELPFTTSDEKETAEAFKTILAKLLRYEKTPSPFRTGFVELPDMLPNPVRQPSQRSQPAKKWRLNKVWEPEDAERRAEFKARNGSISERVNVFNDLSGVAQRRPEAKETVEVDIADGSDEELFQQGLDNLETRQEIRPAEPASELADPSSRESSVSKEAHQTEASTQHDAATHHAIGVDSGLPDSSPRDEPVEKLLDIQGYESPEEATIFNNEVSPLARKPIPVPRPLQTARSVTAPPKLTLYASPPSGSSSRLSVADDAISEVASISSSRDSFYSLEDPPSFELPESTSGESGLTSNNMGRIARIFHSRNISETTTVPDTPRAKLLLSTESTHPLTPTLLSDTSSNSDQLGSDTLAITPPPTLRLRHRQQQLSIHHSNANAPMSILSPIVPTHGKPISSALIKKTYSLLIGPPAHLIALMLRIAARIVSRLPGRDREKIPGSWDTSDAEGDEDEWDDDNEDDFGIPLGNNTTAPNTHRAFELHDDLGRSPEVDGESWEID